MLTGRKALSPSFNRTCFGVAAPGIISFLPASLSSTLRGQLAPCLRGRLSSKVRPRIPRHRRHFAPESSSELGQWNSPLS